jgi:exodeoxyribonuclease V beta subunit
MDDKFNVSTVELENSKLIEASAGTGKTYSVAILVLRLIIEKEIPIEKILMVTFTKAAVAELESRIRKFVRQAYRFVNGAEIEDGATREVVGVSSTIKIELLSKAVQSLDNLSVITIHGFCQKTIDEFTFETNQSFDYEIIQDDSFIFQELVNTYRREVVNTIDDYEWFKEINSYLKFEKMTDILRKCLDGKVFIDMDLADKSKIKETINESNKAYQEIKKQVVANFTRIETTKVHGGSRLAKNRATPKQFLPIFIQDCCFARKYTKEFDFIYDPYGKNYADTYTKVKHCFYITFINSAKATIQKIKQEKGYISYDDQIKTIHRALVNEGFKEKLAKQYQAVFIDEFQDTDKHQYEIFNSVFSGNSILFFIGDPKQSIYGWRSADLDTYKQAKENVSGGVFSMNTNYRSTDKMIKALNVLLNPNDRFNMFMDDEISYVNVGHGAANLGKMTKADKEVLPLTIWEFDKDDFETNNGAVSQEIFRLLTDDIKIKKRKILPKDIGVLVRNNKEGDAIKKALAKLNIPSVQRDDAKVLKSDESELISHLLKAVLSPSRGYINRALNSPYLGFSTDAIKTIDDEQQIKIFLGLKKTLNEEGVYNMISSFLSKYRVRANCMKDVLGQRVLSNITQVAEILHKTEKRYKYTPDELLVWMKRSSDDDNEELQQRIESDENAIQISTIHKSKGLEYKIVFAPCLSMIPKKKLLEKGNVNDFKKEGEYYFTLNYNGLSSEDKTCFDCQKEQENRRLVYVALTRAAYKCYISLIPRAYGKGKNRKVIPSSLSLILDQYKTNSNLIEFKSISRAEFETIHGQYQPQNTKLEFTPREKPQIEIKNTFGIHSFSGLSKSHYTAQFKKVDLGEPEDYDQFIFQILERGANVGNALHNIFERLNFTEPDSWDQTLMDASKYSSNIIKEENMLQLKQLVKHVMNANINLNKESLKLSEINNEQKIPELEFYFSMDKVNKTVINEFLGEEATLSGEVDIEGLMMGFIDLLFEHEGKYYILDWKSNHLGNSAEHYDRTGMEKAMTGSNYHLQYMIYTVAAKR